MTTVIHKDKAVTISQRIVKIKFRLHVINDLRTLRLRSIPAKELFPRDEKIY